MMKLRIPAIPWILPAVDAFVLLAVTLAGFANHNSSTEGGRWLLTFLPLCIGWALVAPWLGNYDSEVLARSGPGLAGAAWHGPGSSICACFYEPFC